MGIQSADKTPVILARPHPIIVDHMRDFLRGLGYRPTLLEDLDRLAALAPLRPAGVVVSTSAVVSESTRLFRDVLNLVEEVLPGTPILIPTLVPFEKLRETFPDLRLLAVSSCRVEEDIFACRDGLLVAQREDFVDAARRAHAGTVVRTHFRRRVS